MPFSKSLVFFNSVELNAGHDYSDATTITVSWYL